MTLTSRRRIALTICVTHLILSAFLIVAPFAFGAELRGTVARVIDGDTFVLNTGRQAPTIRLCGIDAAERGAPGASVQTKRLTDIVRGQTVRCTQVGQGTVCDGRSRPTNNGRIVAQCWIGNVDIAAEVVKAGACDWRKFSGGYYSQIRGACAK